MICGKCGHVRSPDADAPDWQCPACGVAYVKVTKEYKQLAQSRSSKSTKSHKREFFRRTSHPDVLIPHDPHFKIRPTGRLYALLGVIVIACMVAGYYIGRGKLTYEIGASLISNLTGTTSVRNDTAPENKTNNDLILIRNFLSANERMQEEFTKKNKLTASQIDSLCLSTGNLAESIMSARQSGVSISTVMTTVTSGIDDENVASVARNIILSAYEEPMFSFQENKDNAIRKFRNNQEAVCYQVVSRL